MNKRLIIFPIALLALLAGLSARAADPAPQQLKISFEIYRVSGNISGDTSLTDDIYAGKPPKTEAAKVFSFFTICKLTVAGHKLVADDKGWHWDPPARRTDDAGAPGAQRDGLLLLASPKVVVNDGESAAIGFSSDQSLEYFVYKGQGQYELKKLETPMMGLGIKLLAKKEAGGRVHLENMTVTSRLVESRKPLEGTTLNVGEPVVSSREYKTDIHAKLATDYGFTLFTSDGQGILLVRMRVDNMPPEEKKK